MRYEEEGCFLVFRLFRDCLGRFEVVGVFFLEMGCVE